MWNQNRHRWLNKGGTKAKVVTVGFGSLTACTIIKCDYSQTDYFDSLIPFNMRSANRMTCTFTSCNTRQKYQSMSMKINQQQRCIVGLKCRCAAMFELVCECVGVYFYSVECVCARVHAWVKGEGSGVWGMCVDMIACLLGAQPSRTVICGGGPNYGVLPSALLTEHF